MISDDPNLLFINDPSKEKQNSFINSYKTKKLMKKIEDDELIKENDLIRIDTTKIINNVTHQLDSEISHLLMNIITLYNGSLYYAIKSKNECTDIKYYTNKWKEILLSANDILSDLDYNENNYEFKKDYKKACFEYMGVNNSLQKHKIFCIHCKKLRNCKLCKISNIHECNDETCKKSDIRQKNSLLHKACLIGIMNITINNIEEDFKESDAFEVINHNKLIMDFMFKKIEHYMINIQLIPTLYPLFLRAYKITVKKIILTSLEILKILYVFHWKILLNSFKTVSSSPIMKHMNDIRVFSLKDIKGSQYMFEIDYFERLFNKDTGILHFIKKNIFKKYNNPQEHKPISISLRIDKNDDCIINTDSIIKKTIAYNKLIRMSLEQLNGNIVVLIQCFMSLKEHKCPVFLPLLHSIEIEEKNTRNRELINNIKKNLKQINLVYISKKIADQFSHLDINYNNIKDHFKEYGNIDNFINVFIIVQYYIYLFKRQYEKDKKPVLCLEDIALDRNSAEYLMCFLHGFINTEKEENQKLKNFFNHKVDPLFANFKVEKILKIFQLILTQFLYTLKQVEKSEDKKLYIFKNFTDKIEIDILNILKINVSKKARKVKKKERKKIKIKITNNLNKNS